MLVSILADPHTGAASGTPWWVTGLWGLLGTVVGGVITYVTTRSANKSQEKTQRERQRTDQITEIAIRFIHAVARQALGAMKLKEATEEYRVKIEAALKSGDAAAALSTLEADVGSHPSKFSETLKDTASKLNVTTGMLEGIGAAEPALSELNVLLAEMRLVLPTDIVHIAEAVAQVAFLGQLSSALPLPMRMALAATATSALNVFVNAVRHEVGLDYYVAKQLKLQDLSNALQDWADTQTNAAADA